MEQYEINKTVGVGETYSEAQHNANITPRQKEQNGFIAIGIALILLLLVILACIHKKD